jgi:hypothetical protein
MATDTRTLRVTLLGDGSSDRCLLQVLRWLLRQLLRPVVIDAVFADLRPFRDPHRTLVDRIKLTSTCYPADILFVHRDAEGEPRHSRLLEIRRAIDESGLTIPWVSVIPVRMTEAWLLTDERAIRSAADNPSGSFDLNLPSLDELEGLKDPKEILQKALKNACEKKGRRLAQFRRDLPLRVQRVAELIEDFSPLRALGAFRALETETRGALAAMRISPQR